MRNWRVWVLIDVAGNEIARGRKADVEKVWYTRYMYDGIRTDSLYRTEELLAN